MDLLLLAGGCGTRMRPLTENVPKPMLPHGSSTIIEEIVDKVGPYFDNIIISANYMIDYFENHLNNVTVHNDEYGTGTGYAVLTAEEKLSREFVVMNGDIAFKPKVVKNLIAQEPPAIVGWNGRDSDKYGTLVTDNNGNIVSIPEKDNTSGEFVNAGIYYLNNNVFDALKQIEKSERNEHEITDALELLAKDNSINIVGTQNWKSFEYPWDLLKGQTEQHISASASVHEDAIIRGNTYIGPNVTVGKNAEIKGSVLLEGVTAKHYCYIGDSVIGKDVNIGAGVVTANSRHDGGAVLSEGVNTERMKFGAIIGPRAKLGANTTLNPGTVIKADEWTLAGEVR